MQMQMQGLLWWCLLVLIIVPLFNLSGQDTIRITNQDLDPTLNLWEADKIYLLDGDLRLESGVLRIQAGTQIVAKSRSGLDGQPSGLTIGPNARIIAEGTEQAPIRFTTDDPNVFSPDFDYRAWKGIHIQGGANTPAHRLSYLTISYAGAARENEVGAALWLEDLSVEDQIHHVEVFGSKGDGVRIYGGEVELPYLSVFAVYEDAYEWDYGWIGKGLNWFAFRMGYSFSTIDDGPKAALEGRGNIGPNGRTSNPEIFNATFVGQSCGFEQDFFSPDLAIHLTDNTAGLIANSIVAKFSGYGIQVEDLINGADCRKQIEQGKLVIAGNLWWKIGSSFLTIIGSSRTAFEVSDRGIINVDSLAEDPKAEYLARHLLDQGNVSTISGIEINRSDAGCIAIDPRPDTSNAYREYPNYPYPEDAFYQEYIQDEQLKGAFDAGPVWLKNWSVLENTYYVGESARVPVFYKDRRLFPGDTLKISCQEWAEFQDSITYSLPCFPNIILTASVSRRGNQRRRPAKVVINEIQPAYVQNWTLAGFDYGCHAPNAMEVTTLIYDYDPPIIHPVPDGNGGLTALVEDCDETSLTVQTDTIQLDGGIRITYTFRATDFSGNAASLVVELVLTQEQMMVYADLDGDGYGNPDYGILSSGIPSGFVGNDQDCNDTDPDAFPGSTNYFGGAVDNPCIGWDNYDICTSAKELSVDSACVLEFSAELTMRGANPTINFLPGDCDRPKVFRDVWATFTAPVSGSVRIDIENSDSENSGYLVDIFKGDCNALELVQCLDEGLQINAILSELIPGEQYYLRILDKGNLSGNNFKICLREASLINPFEACNSALNLQIDQSTCIASGFDSNYRAPFVIDSSASDCIPRIGRDRWYKITNPPRNDSLRIIFGKLDYTEVASSLVKVYSGDCEDLTEIACNATYNGDTLELTVGDFPFDAPLWIELVEQISGSGRRFYFELCAFDAPAITSSSKEYPVASNSFQVFPNPGKAGEHWLQLQMRESMFLSADLLDLHGRKLRTILYPGTYTTTDKIAFSTQGLQAGIYIIRLQTPSGSLAKKLMIIR